MYVYVFLEDENNSQEKEYLLKLSDDIYSEERNSINIPEINNEVNSDESGN